MWRINLTYSSVARGERIRSSEAPIQSWTFAWSGVFPGRHIGETRVIAERFTVRRLKFLAEVASARFIAMECVKTHQFAQLEEVCNAPGIFECLIQLHRDESCGCHFREEFQT